MKASGFSGAREFSTQQQHTHYGDDQIVCSAEVLLTCCSPRARSSRERRRGGRSVEPGPVAAAPPEPPPPTRRRCLPLKYVQLSIVDLLCVCVACLREAKCILEERFGTNNSETWKQRNIANGIVCLWLMTLSWDPRNTCLK